MLRLHAGIAKAARLSACYLCSLQKVRGVQLGVRARAAAAAVQIHARPAAIDCRSDALNPEIPLFLSVNSGTNHQFG